MLKHDANVMRKCKPCWLIYKQHKNKLTSFLDFLTGFVANRSFTCNVEIFFDKDYWLDMLKNFRLKKKLMALQLLKIFPKSFHDRCLKTSENFTVSWCFQGEKKGCIRYKRVNLFLAVDENWYTQVSFHNYKIKWLFLTLMCPEKKKYIKSRVLRNVSFLEYPLEWSCTRFSFKYFQIIFSSSKRQTKLKYVLH